MLWRIQDQSLYGTDMIIEGHCPAGFAVVCARRAGGWAGLDGGRHSGGVRLSGDFQAD
jgi:hypothetical protein